MVGGGYITRYTVSYRSTKTSVTMFGTCIDAWLL